MYILLTILIILVCILLMLVVLVQNPKGGGLGGTFGGVSQNTLGGAKNAADFLEKATWYLVIGLLVLSLISAAFISGGSGDNDNTKFRNVEEKVEDSDFDGALDLPTGITPLGGDDN